MANYQDVVYEYQTLKREIAEDKDKMLMYSEKFENFITKIMEENYTNLTRIGELESIAEFINFYMDRIVKNLIATRTLAALQ